MSETPKNSRREFMRTSAWVAGTAFGSALFLQPEKVAAQACNDPFTDPRQDYPWNVCVGGKSRATLFLIEPVAAGAPHFLTNLLYGPLATTLTRMQAKLTETVDGNHEGVRAKLQNAVTEHDLNLLDTRLTDAITQVTAHPPATGDTYMDFAMQEIVEWHPDVQSALNTLNLSITVPLIGVDRAQARIVHNLKNQIKTAGAARHIGELFQKQKVDPSLAPSIAYWNAARESGLLWCRSLVTSQINPYQIVEQINNYKCGPGNTCIAAIGSYCQQVDGHCNGMSG